MRYATIFFLLVILATTLGYSHYGYRSHHHHRRRMVRHDYYRHQSNNKPAPVTQCDPNFKTSRCLADCPAGSLPIIGRPCPNGQKCCT